MRSAVPACVGAVALALPASAVEVLGARQDAIGKPAETIPQVVSAIRACWIPPPGLRLLERLDVTVRFSLKRDGALAGPSRVTYAGGPAEPHARELLARSALDAVQNCTPIPLSPGLGASLAGRPLSIRFINVAPRGQGT